ncbi:MAG: DUF3825 domain-containing protein [Chloroflexota bacterium]
MDAHGLHENLFDFADFAGFEAKISYLANNLAEIESWKPSSITLPLSSERDNFYSLSRDHPILASYILNMHKRIVRDERDKFFINSDESYACWNTGLLTRLKEDIFIVFEKNPTTYSRKYWKFYKFLERSNRFLVNIGENLPEMCDFGKNPKDLVFNVKADIVPDLEHILNDHPERYQEGFRSQHERLKRNALAGAIADAKERAKRNFNIAVPQYFSGNIQLLLPLYLTKDTPDLALVLERSNDIVYRANTVLPLDWAYNNARVIKKPDVDWLQP